ncbi:alpha-ketoglutarate-dependent dioxygenase AlkB family protein [Kocuria sp.]|uniref:alpha-ketoglutarate-dependent dioxygenase AlkB family protein n=1 Tax=Kocuria sp. TaxID=1871328 RepID=UPI0026DEB343|nr:alpha-ketoglutarate-dependent dioxygenase AlkB [Kocuria sp.]MDO5619724.1 alpha-ketoglutarate-dependent dioxygenase AlkB [Kocuria sp.]
MRRPSALRGPGGPELFVLDRNRSEVASGAVHVPDWLSLEQQVQLVALCRTWVVGPDKLRHRRLPGGGVMSAQSMVLGHSWSRSWFESGQRTGIAFGGGATATESTPAHDLPPELVTLGRHAIREAYGSDSPEASTFHPTTALINFYDANAHMGMHQDLDETGDDPIVSISLGDTCVFRLGGCENRGQPYQDIELRSGDLFVFGRESRWAYHGVPAVRAGTGSPALGMRHGGRLNITLRRIRSHG